MSVREVEMDVGFVGLKPFLRGRWNVSVVPVSRDPRVRVLNVGVGETCTRNAHRGSASRCTNGVVSSMATDAQGGAALTNVPADTREEFNAAAKTKEAHGKSIARTTPQDNINGERNGFHLRSLPRQLPTKCPRPDNKNRRQHKTIAAWL